MYGWTVVSQDGLPGAQFEHTVVVTDDDVEILTVTADGRFAIENRNLTAGATMAANGPPGPWGE